ncbi:LAFE_0H03378g1_1 [Lachancea fermentati]|uniref:LAFE_0H03378g1_1 n=1 Tax=Lachancea fermentati TaxID=4955 RepID=A0A1G4MJK2_LACFM|nr:LAFE_0H03378g1_1 [Lachancea fermentati]
MKLSTVAVTTLAAGSVANAHKDHGSKTTTITLTSNTHTYGRFNKTKASSTSSSTGTHKYGKFNKTINPTATVYVKDSANGAPSNFGPQKALALTMGGAVVAGALMLL